MYGLDDDLACFFIGLEFGFLDDLLLQGYRLGLGLLFEAFNELGFGVFGRQAGYFFQAADMLFLVFFQLGALDVDDLDLAVEVLFNGFVVLICFSRFWSF